jgi:GAF domain-containing protein
VNATEVLLLVVVLAPLALGLVASALALSLLRRERRRGPTPIAPREESPPPRAPSASPDVDQVLQGRLLAALTATSDRNELLDAILESAIQVAGADAAAVALLRKDEPPLVRALNLAADDAARTVGEADAPPPTHAFVLRYDYSPGEGTGMRQPIETGVVVPLASGTIGTLTAYWRSEHEPSEVELAALEALAARAASAIEGALPVDRGGEDAGVDGEQVDRSQTR